MKKMLQPFVDRVLAKTMSKKLTVFFIGTLFLFLGKLDSLQWIELAKFYIIGQSGVDVALTVPKIFNKKQNETP